MRTLKEGEVQASPPTLILCMEACQTMKQRFWLIQMLPMKDLKLFLTLNQSMIQWTLFPWFPPHNDIFIDLAL